jgi:anhydro-N-acetylmuramic acid kinase
VFHDAVFRDPARRRAIVNIGGISNVTILHPGCALVGFDCGPGNLLMDYWAQTHLGMALDEDGAWARSGNVLPTLLERLLADPFLEATPPKSTGRERFSPGWLSAQLSGRETPADVQATLLEFTAAAIARSMGRFAPGTQEVFLCGGGARNAALVERIAALSSPARVSITDELGVDAQWVEALAFAWLAKCCIDRQPLQLGPVTGARHPCVLGAIYPR